VFPLQAPFPFPSPSPFPSSCCQSEQITNGQDPV